MNGNIGIRVPDVRRIAVLRGGGLGDFIFALPALDALRATYPHAEILLLGRETIEPLVVDRPGPIDRFVRMPALDWFGGSPTSDGWTDGRRDRRTERDADAVLAEVAREGVDIAVQLHGGGSESNPAIARLDARVTVGMQAPGAPPLDRAIPYIYYQSEVMRYLEVVGLVGAAPVGFEPRYRGLRAADRAEALAALATAAGDGVSANAVAEGREFAGDRRPLVVVHPSASDPRRRWPAESFAAVADSVAARRARVSVIGTSAERGIVAAVVGSMHHDAIDLAGRLSLPGLAGLLAEADLVVANDSGPLHLAASVGTATVGIFWCGNLINAGPFTRAAHRPVLSWRLDCPVCGVDCTRGTCPHTASFVEDAPVDEAISAAVDLLDQAPHDRQTAARIPAAAAV